MAGSDPALACGYLQRFEVVLHPARSEVRVVGELSSIPVLPVTQHSLHCAPHHTPGVELGLLSASGGQTSQTGGMAAAGSVPGRFLLMVLGAGIALPHHLQGGGWALSTGLWSHLLQESLPSRNDPSHFSALPVTSSGSFASSAPPAALVPLPRAGPALPRQIPAPWPSWCSWL